jgi:hypothetical protein
MNEKLLSGLSLVESSILPVIKGGANGVSVEDAGKN